MKELILNKYIKVDPVNFDSFVSSEKQSYEEIGIVLAVADGVDIPIGSKVFFDGFMAKKYSDPNNQGKFQWFVQYDEIVKCEYDEEKI